MKRRATVLCIKNGRVLLVAKRRDHWSFPGGSKKPGESLADAAIRELHEETQLVANRVDYLFQFWGMRTRHYVFAAQLCARTCPKPDNEIALCRWIALRNVFELPVSISTKGIVRYLMTGRGRFHTDRYFDTTQNGTLPSQPYSAHDDSHVVFKHANHADIGSVIS